MALQPVSGRWALVQMEEEMEAFTQLGGKQTKMSNRWSCHESYKPK